MNAHSMTAPAGPPLRSASAPEATHRKATTTLLAKFALAGYSAHDVTPLGGSLRLVVTRWDLCRTLNGTEEIEIFLRRIGANPTQEQAA
jgi:hypothetical protein